MRIDSPQLVGTTVISGTLEVTGSVGPGDPAAYDLGTYSKPWRTIFSNALSGSLTKLADGSTYLIAGSKIGISTGSNGSVTISSTSTGADFVAGSTTQVQFNESGNFGASSNLVFDNTNSWLGIGTSSPRAGLDADGGSRFSGQAELTSNAYSGTSLQFGYQLATTSSVAIAPTTALFGANTVLSEFDMTNGSTVNAFYAVPKIIVSTSGQTLNQNGVSSAVYRSYANDLATNANMRGSTVALYMQSSLGSNTTQTAFGFNATIANNKSGHTLVAGSGVEVAGIAAGPITTFTGLNVNPVTGAGTISTLYGLRLQDNAAATVTNRWGISQEDAAAKNYFAGKVGIGTATFGDTFTVNGSVSVTGSILPGTTSTYDLGSSAKSWRDLYARTGSFSGDVSITGNLTVLGTQTIISSSLVNIGDNIILLNSVANPQQYGGLYVADTTANTTGSLIWDSNVNAWLSGLQGSEVALPTGTGTASYVTRWTGTNTLGTGVLYDNGTNVGIGTASPASSLSVASSTYNTPGLTNKGAVQIAFANSNGLSFGSYDSGLYSTYIQGISSPSALTVFYPIALNPVGGNVGIGTTSPGTILHVSDNQANATARFQLANTNAIGGPLRIGYFPDSAGFHITANGNPAHTNNTSNTVTRDSSVRASFELLNSLGSTLADSYLDFRYALTATFSPVMRIQGNGNVGIGTSTYTARLHVSGSSTASTPTMIVREGVVSPTGGAAVLDVQNSAGTSLLFVSGSGWVGLGTTTNPNGYRQINVGDVALFTTNDSAGNTNLRLNSSTSMPQGVAVIGSTKDAVGGGNLTLSTAAGGTVTERLRILSTGDVGIGTASPAQKLHVYAASGNDGIRIETGTNTASDYAVLRFMQGGGEKAVLYTNLTQTILKATTGTLDLWGSGGSGARIDSVGNVGIGTTNTNGNRLAISGGNLSVTGSVLPGPNADSNGYDLGSTTYRWRDIYARSGSYTGDVTISGNLTVAGTQTIVNSTTVNIGDNIILLNSTASPQQYGGIYVADTTVNTTGSLRWNSSTDRWEAGLVGSEVALPTGTGTAAYVARWTGTNTLGTGALYDDSVTVAAGTTTTSGGSGNTWVEGRLIVANSANSASIFLPYPSISYAGFKAVHSSGNISGASDFTDFRMRPSYPSGVGTGTDVNVIRFSNTYARNFPDVLLVPSGGYAAVGAVPSPSAQFTVSGSSTASTPTMLVKEGVVSPTGGAGIFDVQNSAGTSILFVTGSGRVGIGTSAPQAAFHVSNGTSPNLAQIYIGYVGSNNYYDANQHYYRDGNGNIRLTISSTGNVTPATDNAQDLGSTALRWRNVYATSVSGSLTGSNVLAGQVVVAGTGGVLSGTNNLYWNNTNSYLGIGTATPATVLHIFPRVAGDSPEFRLANDGTATGNPTFTLYRNAADYTSIVHQPGGGGLTISTTHPGAPPIVFKTGATLAEVMRIQGDGNVGIGTTNPNGNRLAISGGNLSVTGSVLPGVTNTHDLGSTTYAWRDVYARSGSYSGDVTISGNLTVAGTQTIINTQVVEIKDNAILLNAGPSPASTGGVYVADNTTSITGSLVWDTTTDQWKAGRLGSETTLVSGSGTTNYLAKWSGSNAIGTSVVYDDGTNIGIGTASDGTKLYVRYDNASSYTSSGFNTATLHLRNGTGASDGLTMMSFGSAWSGGGWYLGLVDAGASYASNFVFQTRTGVSTTAERMRIDSYGNVGIGTTTLLARLHISGSSTASTPTMIVREGVVSPANGAAVLDVQNSAGTTILFVTGSQRVGIGTSNPSYLLDVAGTAYIRGTTIGDPGVEGAYRIKFADTGGTYNDTGIGIDSSSNLWFNTVATTGITFNLGTNLEAMRLSSVGNLLLGTTSNLARLTVSGSSTTTTPTAVIKAGTTVQGSGIPVLDVQNSAGSTLLFVSGSGRIGVGTTPSATISNAKLEVNGSVVPTTHLGSGNNLGESSKYWGALYTSAGYFYNAGVNSVAIAGQTFQVYTETSPTAYSIYADANNRVGIGAIANSSVRLFVSGTSTITDTTLLVKHGTANGSALAVINAQNSAGTSLLFVSGSGKVGIGTTVPANALDVRGTLGIGTPYNAQSATENGFTISHAGQSSAGGIATFAFPALNTNDEIYFNLSKGGGAYGQFNVNFGVSTTNRFRISGGAYVDGGNITLTPVGNTHFASGNVGIGTSGLDAKLVVNGSSVFSGSVSPDGDVTRNLGSSSKRWSNVYAAAFSGSLTRLSDGSSYLIAGNNVTITTGSNGSITIDSSGGGGGGGAVTGTGTSNYISKWSSSSALSDSSVYDSGTGVGIGVTSFSARLFVSGTAAAPTAVLMAGTYSQIPAVLDVQNNAGNSLFFVSGSGEIGLNQNISSVQTAAITTTTLTATTLLSVSSTIFRSAEFIVQGSDVTGTKFTTAKILAIQDGTTTSYTEYGAISLGGLAGTFSVTNPSTGTFLLQVTPTSTNSTTWKVTAILTKV